MNHSDIAALMKGAAPVIADLVGKTVQPLVDQISALKQEVAELRAIDQAATVADLVADAVGKIVFPTPEAGKDADPEETRQLVDEAVKAAVDALPAPEPGKPGEVDLVALSAMVDEAVSKLPPAEPGKSVTVEDVAPLLEQMVKAAVADLPAAEPGKSVTVDDVAPMLAELVDKAVAALPSPEPGAPGAPGKLPTVKAWEDRVYYEGECALFDGSTYQAGKDTGRAPPHEDWTCIAQAGRNGVNGRSLTIRGTFADVGDYQALDLVALNGGSFVAKIDNPGSCPGEGWQLVASRGKPGAPGEGRKGDPGIGRKGDPGEPVVSAHIDDNGMLTLVNGDGSTVECDLYPVLAKIAPTSP